jgi:hypothetical protein
MGSVITEANAASVRVRSHLGLCMDKKRGAGAVVVVLVEETGRLAEQRLWDEQERHIVELESEALQGPATRAPPTRSTLPQENRLRCPAPISGRCHPSESPPPRAG